MSSPHLILNMNSLDFPSAQRWPAFCETLQTLADIRTEVLPDRFRYEASIYSVGSIGFVRLTTPDTFFASRSAAKRKDHPTEVVTINYYCRGGCRGIAAGSEIRRDATSVTIFDENAVYELEYFENDVFGITVPKHLLSNASELLEHNPVISWANDSAEFRFFEIAIQLIFELLSSDTEQVPLMPAVNGLLGLINGMLDTASVKATAGHSRDNEMKDFARSNLHLAQFGVEEICAYFNCSRSSVYRAFQANGGVSRFMNEARLRRAYEMLLHIDAHQTLQLKQLALSLGFSSYRTFSRQFKQRFGIQPSHLKERGGYEHRIQRRAAIPKQIEMLRNWFEDRYLNIPQVAQDY